MSESGPADASTSAESPLDAAHAAVESGDWASARKKLRDIDPATLADDERARYENLSAQMSPDFAAIFVAGALGFTLIAILAALYM